MVAVDAERGQLHWRAEVGGELSASPAIDNRCVYIATQYQDVQGEHLPVRGTLRALSRETGVTLWMRTLPAPIRGGLVASQTAIFGGAADGRVYSFDKRSGLTLWINQYSESISNQPAISGRFLYFGSDAGTLFALDQANGQLAWRYRSRGPIHRRGWRCQRRIPAACAAGGQTAATIPVPEAQVGESFAKLRRVSRSRCSKTRWRSSSPL